MITLVWSVEHWAVAMICVSKALLPPEPAAHLRPLVDEWQGHHGDACLPHDLRASMAEGSGLISSVLSWAQAYLGRMHIGRPAVGWPASTRCLQMVMQAGGCAGSKALGMRSPQVSWPARQAAGKPGSCNRQYAVYRSRCQGCNRHAADHSRASTARGPPGPALPRLAPQPQRQLTSSGRTPRGPGSRAQRPSAPHTCSPARREQHWAMVGRWKPDKP